MALLTITFNWSPANKNGNKDDVTASKLQEKVNNEAQISGKQGI